MEKYLNRIPTQYRFAVRAFYQDSDGWWIELQADGPYYFDRYASEYTIHETTQKAALAAFREHITARRV